MNFITAYTWITAAVCSTFAAIYFGIWSKQRPRIEYLLFAAGAFSVAVFAGFESAAMHATATAEYGAIVRWAHLPAWGMIVLLPWFVYFYLHAGRPWLLWTITILRTLVVIINFILTPNINHREVLSIRQLSFFGESVSIPQVVPRPWMLLGQSTLLLSIVFFADVAITAWRRGERRRALTIGSTTTFFSVANLFAAVLVLWGLISLPFTLSIFFTAIIIAMGFELSSDLLRTVELGSALVKTEADLREADLQLRLSAQAAQVGTWTWSIGENTIWTSDFWHELFEFEPSQSITYDDFMQKIHLEDRPAVEKVLITSVNTGELYETEYRILLGNGETRWISSRGKLEYVEDKPALLRGASVDITKRKLAEAAAHDLSARLIGAQEAERIRLARELHDDLSQSTALLAIHLDVLARETVGNQNATDQIDNLSSDIDRLSSDLHRIAHELHPSKLQLGLESALRGFCHEVAAARKFKVDFEANEVPRSLPDNISLCLYRIVQESLQNVGKHSGASSATVKISADSDGISLSICDNGGGFDPEGANAKAVKPPKRKHCWFKSI